MGVPPGGSGGGGGPAALSPVMRNQLEGVNVAARQPSFAINSNVGTANRQLASQIAQTVKGKPVNKKSSAYPTNTKKGI